MEDNEKNNNVKVVYGKENLKEIITSLIEKAFEDTIKESEKNKK